MLISQCSFYQRPARQFFLSKTADEMIVDHSNRLHKRITDRWANEFKTAAAQIPAQSFRFRSLGRNGSRGSPPVLDCSAINKIPHISVETAKFPLRLKEGFGVLNGGLDL